MSAYLRRLLSRSRSLAPRSSDRAGSTEPAVGVAPRLTPARRPTRDAAGDVFTEAVQQMEPLSERASLPRQAAEPRPRAELHPEPLGPTPQRDARPTQTIPSQPPTSRVPRGAGVAAAPPPDPAEAVGKPAVLGSLEGKHAAAPKVSVTRLDPTRPAPEGPRPKPSEAPPPRAGAELARALPPPAPAAVPPQGARPSPQPDMPRLEPPARPHQRSDEDGADREAPEPIDPLERIDRLMGRRQPPVLPATARAGERTRATHPAPRLVIGQLQVEVVPASPVARAPRKARPAVAPPAPRGAAFPSRRWFGLGQS